MNVVLDTRVAIEYPASTEDPTYGTPVITWTPLCTIWAEVRDVAPSRAEAVKMGLAVATNQVRVRYRFRSDVTSAMRLTIRGAVDRVLQVVGGPAELGRHEYSEIVAEQISS